MKSNGIRVVCASRWVLGALLAWTASACGSGGGGGGGSGGSGPSAPASLAATAGNGQVQLAWPAVSGAASYTLYWSTASPVDPSTAAHQDSVASPYVHAGLANSSTYWYVVTASNAQGESGPSPETSATPSASASLYDPPWSSIAPLDTLTFDYDPLLTSAQNGAALKAVIQGLQPGDRLEIGTGTYSVNSFFSIDEQGTAQAPIWIVAKPGETPVLTRADASQNAVNVGAGSQARYLCLRDLEITGGDTGMKLYACHNVWIDACHVHDVAGAGLAANSDDVAWLYLTRNHVHHTAGTGEGMYLGANNGVTIVQNSVIALNHVHDTGGTQGDGIELKQGSFGNWIAENVVHDCNYPCILVYGTGGQLQNVVERNVCWNSGDNVMQVQGEALVRNNLLMHGTNGFGSHDHQGQVRDLTFVHNTIVNVGRGAQLSNWSGRPNLVFANNVVYSQTQSSIVFGGGSNGVTLSGNLVVGSVVGASGGTAPGSGLGDFADVTWDAVHRDATPAAQGSIVDSGDPLWAVPDDLTGAPRALPLDAGCFDGP